MYPIVVYLLVRHMQLSILSKHVPSIWISVESREVRAGDVQPDPMALKKYIAGWPEVNAVLVNGTRLKQFLS